jgi:hypothetical protein
VRLRRPVLRSTLLLAAAVVATAGVAAARPYPILFVTQTPTFYDFTAVASVFGNHQTDLSGSPRGGDLYVLYPDGSLKNLTQLAGLGVPSGHQGTTSIAVREPAVHWSGTKAIFSLVVGAPGLDERYLQKDYFWQLYEVTGLGKGEPVVITKVANQPAAANNVSPAYLSDGRILFTSDRPRNGAAHLYPQLDEYEEAPTVTGLWVLEPASGHLEMFDHAPSGDFKPTVDSYGRIVFTRWDHLQRDQQADDGGYGTFNWLSEAANAATGPDDEIFPEPRHDVLPAFAHTFNQFFPWMVNQDGTGLETLNHVGRHDLSGYFNRSLDDDALTEFICHGDCGRANHVETDSFLQIRQSPTDPRSYYGVDAPEFRTHAAGQLLSILGEPGRAPDNMPVTAITHGATADFTEDGAAVPTCHSGLYRQPLELSDGTLVAVHAGERAPGQPETRQDRNTNSDPNTARQYPGSRYKFRLVGLGTTGPAQGTPGPNNCTGFRTYGAPLTPGITKTLEYWDPDEKVHYDNVTLWELDPVEVRPRPVPPMTRGSVPDVEADAFAAQHVEVEALQAELARRDLALIVSRDVTTRDGDDHQQPYNLFVQGGTASTIADPTEAIYGVAHLQLFQGDQVRGLGGAADPRAGRRVLAQPAHDAAAVNPPVGGGAPPTSVPIAADGSVVALVPSHRALTWQLTASGGEPVVRERYWLTMKAGEVRVCTSCHGLSSHDQTGAGTPQNPPAAIQSFVQWWKATTGELFRTGFERGVALWSTKTP